MGQYRGDEESAGNFLFGLGVVALLPIAASAPWLIPVIQFKQLRGAIGVKLMALFVC
jgi:hypothetical protein